jgi:hypothetical protein
MALAGWTGLGLVRFHSAHGGEGTDPGAYPNLTALNLRMCSVIATSTGRRSMLDAP